MNDSNRDWEKHVPKEGDPDKNEKPIKALDDEDIQILRTYVGSHRLPDSCVCVLNCVNLQGQGPYAKQLKSIEAELKEIQKRVNEKMGA